jgi:hypothetical protein
MKLWKIIASGVFFAIISQIIHTMESIATMGFYTDPAYFGVWSKIMMPTAGPPGTEFYIYSIVFSIISGIVLTVVFEMTKKGIPGKSLARQGLYFGMVLFLISLTWTMTLYLLVNLPALLLIYWSISGLIAYLIGGMIIAKIMK